MSAHVLSPVTYLIVLAVLVALTVLTVAVSFLDLSGFWHTLIGLSIGVCKASLVVLFFMHVIFSPRVTWIVLAVTLFWLIAVLLILAMSDYVTRGMIPLMPGH